MILATKKNETDILTLKLDIYQCKKHYDVFADSLKSLDVMAYLSENWQSFCPFVLDIVGELSLTEAANACTQAWQYYMNSEPIDYQNFYQHIKVTEIEKDMV